MSRVLVVQLARFGDLVQTKRLILSLESQGNEVHLCLDHSLADLARLVYPRAVLHPIQAHAAGLSASQAARILLTDNRKAFARLRDAGFEMVYNLNYSGMNFRLAGLFDRAMVHGYAQFEGQGLKGIWPDLAMRWSGQRRIGLNLVDFWAGYAPKMVSPDKVNPAAKPGGAGLGVVLAGRESRRSLPPKALARLVETMYDRIGQGSIRLLGSKAEADLGRALSRELRPNYQEQCENLAGKTDWTGLAEVLADLDAVITPDTGTMHLACHLGAPVLAVFLSSAWCFETGPYGAGHRVLQAVDSCLPCLESQPCPHQVRCRAPLEDPALARYLHTGKAEHLPSGLLDLDTGFDGLGVVYTDRAGQGENLESRNYFRQFLQRHLYPRLPHGQASSSITDSTPGAKTSTTGGPTTSPTTNPAISQTSAQVPDSAASPIPGTTTSMVSVPANSATTSPSHNPTTSPPHHQDAHQAILQDADQRACHPQAWAAGGLSKEAQWLYREAQWMAPQRLGPKLDNPSE